MTSIKEVANLAGVSVGSVLRVINNSGGVKRRTRRKVEDAIKVLNYIPMKWPEKFPIGHWKTHGTAGCALARHGCRQFFLISRIQRNNRLHLNVPSSLIILHLVIACIQHKELNLEFGGCKLHKCGSFMPIIHMG
jgi:hypothetical protein